MREAFNRPDVAPFAPKVPPITIGGITEMVVLRKKIAEGTAKPTEIAYFEAQAAAREKAIESAVEQSADALIESRHMPLHIAGLFGPMYKVAERVRAKGYSGKDFCENSAFISGGLKRAQVPPNYREFIFETLNLSPERYLPSPTACRSSTPTPSRCKAGRYHMAPWVMLLLLDESGENLIEPATSGELEGRAAFFDLSLDGRWGGVISGDKIRATWAPCACGNAQPIGRPGDPALCGHGERRQDRLCWHHRRLRERRGMNLVRGNRASLRARSNRQRDARALFRARQVGRRNRAAP